ncbi:hypothetical protein K2173_009769 [Erythroxylum novogranatense]|uniref:Uncharacterized protein n=1 Tax=Erythroxylum novogranatense TaxID=1862640 RepID=A0AAV8TWC3_9ROSI|nr:hypothetical protein K2173_009769 [Erythroxylum novogranatense]
MEDHELLKNITHNNNSTGVESGYSGVPIHSQVKRIIKQELDIIKYPSLQELEMRGVISRIKRQRSRSPLGLAERPIAVGN